MFQNNNKDIAYLLRILQHIGKTNNLCAQFNNLEALYNHNEQTEFNAILTYLTQIGENAAKLSEKTKAIYNTIQWQKIKDFRNFIVQDYTGVNKEKVFETIKIEFPILKTYIENIIKEEVYLENFNYNIIKEAKENSFYKFVNFENIIEQ